MEPIKYATATTYYMNLRTSAGDIKTTPTIAAGDFKVSTDLGVTFNNLASLPAETASGSGVVAVALSEAETTAAVVIVRAIDQAGAEWQGECAILKTFGHASSAFPTDPTDAVRGGMTALPNVASGGDGSVMLMGASQAVALKRLHIVNDTSDPALKVVNSSDVEGGADAIYVQASRYGIFLDNSAVCGLYIEGGECVNVNATHGGNALIIQSADSLLAPVRIIGNRTDFVSVDCNGGIIYADIQGSVLGGSPRSISGIGVWAAGASGAAVSTLDGSGVQSALTAQGVTTARAAKLDNLDRAITAIPAAPTAAAVADAIYDEILSGHAIAGSGAAVLSQIATYLDVPVSQIPGWYTTTVASPLVFEKMLRTVQNQAATVVLHVEDSNSDPIDLSAKTLRFVAYLPSATTASWKRETGDGITVGGTGNGTATVTLTTANTATATQYRWLLWDVTAALILAEGTLDVRRAPINT